MIKYQYIFIKNIFIEKLKKKILKHYLNLSKENKKFPLKIIIKLKFFFN